VKRPVQNIRIGRIQDRTSRAEAKRPFIVRWKVDGVPFSEAHYTQPEADRYRARLIVARQDGERFDTREGVPVSWLPAADAMQLHEWAREWVKESWAEWAPRTRDSALEGLYWFVPLVCDPAAPPPPAGIRRHLKATLEPEAEIDPHDPSERWLARWCLSLGALDRSVLAEAERKLTIGTAGQPRARSVSGRYRKVGRACIGRAVELNKLTTDPRPPDPKGRKRRKVNRKRQAIDVRKLRKLPGPEAMVEVLAAIVSHQPASFMYRAMTAIVYYAGLRPSEVVMLRPRALYLPKAGWGWIEVTEADDGYDEPTEPKEGVRTVPIPPVLVAILLAWLEDNDIADDALMFRTRNDNRPAESNWNRTLHRACRKVLGRTMRVYDCRHACATFWIRTGVDLAEAARRLGHSVETLVATYIGVIEGDDARANKLIDAALPAELPPPRPVPHSSPKDRRTAVNNGQEGNKRSAA
jgi:integrase